MGDEMNEISEQAFDWSLDPKSLSDIYKQTNFNAFFANKISKDVIKNLSPQLNPDSHSLTYDEQALHDHLLGPMEKFILDLDDNVTIDDIQKVLDQIQSLNQPSKLCRRILKTGDVTFACYDCGQDATCVVCIDCFHKSAHKDHNYRMSNSDGGCCDCGDVEAWKQNYACTDHMGSNQPNLTLSDFEDRSLRSKQIRNDKENIILKINRLPKGIALRYYLICQASLRYANSILTWEEYNSLPALLEINDDNIDDPELNQLISKDTNSKNYFTVLFNDEVHTYDHVISALVKTIKCTKMTASIMASTISREGRSLIKNDIFQVCNELKKEIAKNREGTQRPLKVEVIHGAVLAHQAFALRLIQWVCKMSSISDAFRILTSYTLLGFHHFENQEETLVERIMLSNTKLWKIARVEWNDLFVTSLLTEYSIKQQFARLITRSYPSLMKYFIEDDHDHSVSILTLTTQLYTVPSLTCMLIEEEYAIEITLRTFLIACSKAKRENPSMSFENRHTFLMDSLRRAFYIIYDVRHLISVQPTKWTDSLRINVINGVKLFLNLLELMQGIDSVKRQIGQHLEYEPDWESGMTLQSKLIGLITRFVEYCSLDDEVLLEVLTQTQIKLINNGGFKMITRECLDKSVNCINYDVLTMPVSIHLPLTRFAAALIVMLMKRRPSVKKPYDEELVILPNMKKGGKTKLSMIEIMEPSLRAEVMIAQFRSGMWRRNGYSLVNQIIYFHGSMMRKEMFDRDILLFQECAAMCDPDEFMIHLLNKFNLFNWVTSETIQNVSSQKANIIHNDEELTTLTMSLGEEFLQLLLTIVGERYRVGVGNVEEDDVIKHEIIQLLCVGPLTRSDITQKLNVNDNELDCIKAVAQLKRSTSTSTGKYELREEFYDRFNPFFYHYSRRLQSNALDAQLKRKKILGHSLICCPPPAPVELTSQFSNLNDLLTCDITLTIIQKVLRRTFNSLQDNSDEAESSKSPSKFGASELQLDQCLHLIGIGLYEQERNPATFWYLVFAHHKDIFLLLRDIHSKIKHSKDLILWLMKKADSLVDQILALAESNPSRVDNVLKSISCQLKDLFRPALSTEDNASLDTKKRNSQLAAQRRERIMAMMKANQDKFLSNPTTKQLVAETENHEHSNANQGSQQQQPQNPAPQSTGFLPFSLRLRRSKALKYISGPTKSSKTTRDQPSSAASETKTSLGSSSEQTMIVDESERSDTKVEKMDVDSNESDVELNEESQEELIVAPESNHLCILCREEQAIGFHKPTMVLLAYIQRSAVLSKNRTERRIPNYNLTPTNQIKHHLKSSPGFQMYSFTSDNSWSFDATFMPSDLFFSPHISTCGHEMHYDCWKSYSDAVKKRETSRTNRSARHVSFEPDKDEILCPLCECISNATIPLLPNYTCFASRRKKPDDCVNSIFSTPLEVIEKSSERLSACLNALRGTVDMFKHIRHIKEVSTNIAVNYEDKHIRLLQPRNINDVLEELGEMGALGLRDFISSIRNQRISSSSCTKTLLKSMSNLSERIHLVGLDLVHLDNHLPRIFLMTSWTVAYTIQTYERVSRFKGSPVFHDLESSSKNLGLSSLLRFAFGSMMTHQSDMMQSLLVRKLRYLLINDEHLSSSPCCLDIDAFEMLVSLLILMQKLYSHIDDVDQYSFNSPLGRQTLSHPDPSTLSSSPGSISSTSSRNSDSQTYAWITQNLDHEYFRNLVHWMLILNLIQICVSLQTELTLDKTKQEEAKEQDSESFDSQECSVFKSFYQEILLASGHPNHNIPNVDDKFCTKIRARLLPFLRSCAIFMFHLSHIPPPSDLRTKSAFDEDTNHNGNEGSIYLSDPRKHGHYNKAHEYEQDTYNFHEQINFETVDNEFNNICMYLDLPNKFSILLQSQEARHLARSWLRHSRVIVLIESALNRGPTSKEPVASKVSLASKPTSRLAHSSNPSQSSALAGEPPSSSSASSSPSVVPKTTELMPVRFVHQPHSVNRLINLPHDYSELVDKVSDFSCPSIKNEDSRTPTLCLVCGVMLCSQSYCCQRDLNDLASNYHEFIRTHNHSQPSSGPMSNFMSGVANAIIPVANPWAPLAIPNSSILAASRAGGASGSSSSNSGAHSSGSAIHQQLVGSCTYHAYECSGGVGIFLRIRQCQILLLSGRSKGCYMPAPYIDDHGETDFGLMRGNPLHLNQDHYRKVGLMWLTHSIPEQISRTLEYSPYFSSINWHLH